MISRCDLSCGDGLGVRLCVGVRIDPHLLVQDSARALPCKVEVAVVGHVEKGILLWHSVIVDLHLIVPCQSVGDCDIHFSRVSLISVRAVKTQHDVILPVLFHSPHPLAVEVHAAVEIVSIVIFVQLIRPSIQLKGGASDAVGHSSHDSSEKFVSGLISSRIIIAKNYIDQLSFPVRHKHLHQSGAVI